MIEGLRIEMTFDELVSRLNARIAEHEQGVVEFEERLLLEAHGTSRQGADGRRTPRREDTPRHMLEHQRDEHAEYAAFLTLVRDHLVPGEIYRLGESDLRFADLTPGGICW